MYDKNGIVSWPSYNTNYTVQAISQQGCTVTDTLRVKVNISEKFSLGNDTAFCTGNMFVLHAPDNFVGYMQPEKYYFAVYNRFGQKVFETKDVNRGRNGVLQSMIPSAATTFAWVCTYKLTGEPEKTEKGTVVLLP